MKTRLRYRQVLRETILDAAREAFLRQGYESVSMRALAERVGCTHGNLYLHFKNKRELFDALVDESFAQFAAGFQRLLEANKRDDAIRIVKKAGRAYVDFGLKNPGVYEFAFILRRSGPRSRKPHAAYEMLRALVARCIEETGARADVDVTSQALWAAVHGITSLLLLRPAFPWADKNAVIRRVIDTAADGLLRAR